MKSAHFKFDFLITSKVLQHSCTHRVSETIGAPSLLPPAPPRTLLSRQQALSLQLTCDCLAIFFGVSATWGVGFLSFTPRPGHQSPSRSTAEGGDGSTR